MDVAFGEWGFLMLGEMVKYMMHYRMNSDPVERLVRKAMEFDVPVHVHISTCNSAQGSFTSGTEELLDFPAAGAAGAGGEVHSRPFRGMPAVNPTVVEGYLDIVDHDIGGMAGELLGRDHPLPFARGSGGARANT